MKTVVVSFAVAVLLLTGCGGDRTADDERESRATAGRAEPPSARSTAAADALFALSRVESCLKKSLALTGTMRFDEGNQLATPAVQGELRADFERNKLNIAFERNESDAEAREANVRELSEMWDEGYQCELVVRRANAVWAWENTPTQSEEQLDECLTR